MKVLLVDNLVMPEEGSLARLDVHPHLGLLSLAAVAEADGHTVQIYDPKRLIKWGQLPYDSTLYERAALDLLAARPDAVGFTALGCSFLFALNVAALLKRREPDLPILLGGPHATMLHRQILERFPQFDVIVRHEADEIFPAVLANLAARRFQDIPGLSWRGARAQGLHFNEGKPIVHELDRLPRLNYDHYPVAELGLELLRIEAGRGCPFMCTFCSTATFFQRSFRLKSAARLVAE
ncbi:MAG TPA: cobalamin-dependent protein, partial [Pyrinomonadaceae bacterium]|nr:cobalamin-dependent protein [Pyrinomonadaceae bacterium]